ncbi:hypothetical protein [Parenemella sanctibonifatiensis]|uniref:Uncharacterized protein n=1 Tax=Parenemella sanctibonifatiensis TaxID=2016505 RepID=A0A255EMV3_9ACTN|nr:hypothetical protein [Parenemella sanctibonifatiensis]OYN92311.1 hypothetical protein CGZ91_02045 [Parenemella sanctibonifatiensis]
MTSSRTARPSRSRIVLILVGGVVVLGLAWVAGGLVATTLPGKGNPLHVEASAVIEDLCGVALERPAEGGLPYRVVHEGGIEIATTREAVETEVARVEAALAERGGWSDAGYLDINDHDVRIHRTKLINGRQAMVTMAAFVRPVAPGEEVPTTTTWSLTFEWA